MDKDNQDRIYFTIQKGTRAVWMINKICEQCLNCKWYWENRDDDYMNCDGEEEPCYIIINYPLFVFCMFVTSCS